ncbi:MAG TPA: PilZ domain-containing protein [Polyangiaceae bacterium]|nr:PilZ domain-containing protein [Polyangiaceae bacterium]
MASTRSVLALGKFSSRERAELENVAGEAAFTMSFADAGAAPGWLASHSPDAVLLDESDAARSLCLEARAEARHAQVPMISLFHGVDDLSFAEAFSWGGDDAVDVRAQHGLVTRLRGLPKEPPAPPKNGRGTALIVDADRSRRIVLGRVLRNAGFTIEFAVSGEDALARVAQHAPGLVVAESHISESASALLAAARAQGSDATWIVRCPPKDLRAVRGEIEALGNATVTDGFAAAENVVFLANEFRRGGANDKRASRRLLYGTTVSFRSAGREADDHGYSYNVSLGGLYVRTLAPPEEDVVWIELQPPRCERRVRLEGSVVWRRKFGPSEGATVPPGFGVALSDATRRDMDAWRKGYEAFSQALGFAT